jgi:outer membrane receptor protein involved in Fe transport
MSPPQSWAFVQDGAATNLPTIFGRLTANPAVDQDWFLNRGYEDQQQLMAVLNYRQAYNDNLQLDYHLAYHQTRYRWLRTQTLNPLEFRINEFADDGHVEAKIIATQKFSDNHVMAFGAEAKYQPFSSRRRIENGADLPVFHADWTTLTHALMLEDQWQLNDTTTSFAGFRLDKHDYTNWYFSPRLALVHELNSQDRLKATAARSLRRPMEILMLLDRNAEPGKTFSPETLDSLELRWERQQTPALSYDASMVFERLNAFDTALNGFQSRAGRFDIGALELALKYQSDRWQIDASHSYTQLIDAQQRATVPVTVISVEDAANGIGNDLGFWSNHLSKIALLYDLAPTLKLSSSLVHYWGFPGTDDFSRWITANAGNALPGNTYTRYGVYDGSNTRTGKGNTYFNAGLKWQPTQKLGVAFDGYNLLGLFDEEISKRNFIGENAGSYQIDPASFAIKLDYQF